MLTLIREGGYPMWFILAFGLVALGAAARFAWKPARTQLGFIAGMTATVLFATVQGICADLAAVGHHLNERWDDYDNHARALAQGLAESMSPGMMGFSVIAMVALLCAVGAPRLARTS